MRRYCAIWDNEKGDVKVPCPQMRDAANAQELAKVRGVVEGLSRQIIVGEMSKEQRVRYEGASGLTQTRGYRGGDKAYHEASYTNVGFANFHNHANNKHVVGMGEIAAVLNGVEFWTRHNDYHLESPDPDPENSKKYHATKYVVQPDVPPEVLKLSSVPDQAEEMRRWFHAWQDEDPKCPTCKKLDEERVKKGLKAWDTDKTERYYPDYFRPILCVLEGAWIKQSDAFEESFASDRHFVDAKDWRELYDKNRFLYQSGRKSTQENLPFLPLSVRGLQGTAANETLPTFANWEYRIICSQPLKQHLPLHNFRVASDLAVQLGISSQMMTLEQLSNSRKARFELNAKNQTTWVEGTASFDFWRCAARVLYCFKTGLRFHMRGRAKRTLPKAWPCPATPRLSRCIRFNKRGVFPLQASSTPRSSTISWARSQARTATAPTWSTTRSASSPPT